MKNKEVCVPPSLPYSLPILFSQLKTSRWTSHSGRINSIAWTADSQYCASASLDTDVYVWSIAKPFKSVATQRKAAPGGANAVLWLDDVKSNGSAKTARLASTGADGCVKVWEVTFPA